MSASVANDCIEEAKSEDEEETEKMQTEMCSNPRNESTLDEDDLEYSMEDSHSEYVQPTTSSDSVAL